MTPDLTSPFLDNRDSYIDLNCTSLSNSLEHVFSLFRVIDLFIFNVDNTAVRARKIYPPLYDAFAAHKVL